MHDLQLTQNTTKLFLHLTWSGTTCMVGVKVIQWEASDKV